MKNLKFLLSLSIIATLLFASCSKEESVNVVEPAGNLVSITATTPNPIDTKAYLEEENGKVVTKWHEGDQISVYDANLESHAFTLKNGVGTTSGTFEGEATKELKAAAFPYSEGSVYKSGTLEGFIMPGMYGIDDHVAIPMFATVGANNNFQFKALGGFIQVRYQNVPAEASYLHFKVKEGYISGQYKLENLKTDNFTSERISTENSGDNEVTIALPKADKDGIVTINIPVLGATYELNGFTMKLLDKDLSPIAISVKETNDKFSYDVKAGKIVRLPVVDLEKLTPEVKKVSVQEFLDAEVSDTQWYELTGKVDNIWMDKKDKTKQNPYGNFDLVDENVKVHIHGLTATKTEDGSNDKSFSSLGLKEGDVITIHTLRQDYYDTPQGGGDTPAYFISRKIFPEISVTGENSIAFDQTSLELNVASNCVWKVVAKSEGLTINPKNGNGDAKVEVSFAQNNTEAAKEYSITFEATSDGETIEKVFNFTHRKQGEVFVPETFYEITLGKNLPEGWSAENDYNDNDKNYHRFGSSKQPGSATTCALGITSPKAMFTFEIAAWNNNKEVSKLNLSIIGDGTFADGSKIKLIEGYAKEPNFTQIEEIIVGANAETKIKFESKNKTKNRFFLKSVKVESCE